MFKGFISFISVEKNIIYFLLIIELFFVRNSEISVPVTFSVYVI